MKKLIAVIMLLSSFILNAAKEETVVYKVVVIPFQSMGIDDITMKTAESLLKNEIEQIANLQVISTTQTLKAMDNGQVTEVEDAVKVGNELLADLVLITSLNKLGEKVIIQYIVVDVYREVSILADNVTAQSIENLDMIMKRIAMSIRDGKTMDETLEVGTITETESKVSKRRQGLKYFGFSFGYLFPMNGFDGDRERIFTCDTRTGFEMDNNMTVGLQLAIRNGFATNIYTHYLFSKSDFCPYAGGALGFHWVLHGGGNHKRGDGMELIASTGLRAFRTYNFQVLLNLDYSITMNDYDDRSLVFTIGLMK
ncbi:MAG: hypothetical protein DRH79_03815 [Candidatus Cloacimonadota bacterium]|nr:MAG: hypothetical protein DRH79_03815 [Candidatus Cloacimonadota bacterium]